jgi:hypothetical protein
LRSTGASITVSDETRRETMVTREDLQALRKAAYVSELAKELGECALPENKWETGTSLALVAGAGLVGALINPEETIVGALGAVLGAATGVAVVNVVSKEQGRDCLCEVGRRVKENTPSWLDKVKNLVKK